MIFNYGYQVTGHAQGPKRLKTQRHRNAREKPGEMLGWKELTG